LIYRLLFKLVLRHVDAERAHALAARSLRAVRATALGRAMVRRLVGPPDDLLRVRALGMTFPSPLGVAAGVDKDATWFEDLRALGFGFIEVGTVTALEQEGTPRPRVERLVRDRALLNRMGFPNPGAPAVADRLRRRAGETIVGVNVGKSRDAPLDAAGDDYRASVREVAPWADYLVINVSSPNTPGLREMQAADVLRPLIGHVRAELRQTGTEVPLLVKIGPDLDGGGLDAVARLALELELDGIVAVNTSPAAEGGGISGAPLKPRSLEVLRLLRARVGDGMVIISVGGIETPDDAWERIRAGATLVQAYTAFVYGGPAWPRRMNRGLARRMREAASAGAAVSLTAARSPRA
jgi:dihydroorotate dehydrogenase